ncbi:MAG: Hpt domain-containing protein [Tsuneonella sp.]|jgi:HPt (histidine-containing phosphotransfer) domain-containing protein
MSTDDAWLDPLKAKFAVRLASEGDALLALVAAHDSEGLIDRAHKLAGLAGMLGAPGVGEAALRLEETARAGGDWAPELDALLDAICQALA